MDSPYECEVRYFIDNITSFDHRLAELGARTMYSYEFTDYYYRPGVEQWDPVERNLRIRQWMTPNNPTTVLFCKNQIILDNGLRFKRAVYPQGKIPLFTADLEMCKSLVADLGFQPWLRITKRNARLIEIPNDSFRTALEFIDGLGWMGELEVEGSDIREAAYKLQASLGILGVDRNSVDFRPISAIVSSRPDLRSERGRS